MEEKRSNCRKEIKRHSVFGERYCWIRFVSGGTLDWIDQSAKIVDLSIIGIGVECDIPVRSGIAWFKESVYGQKCGSIVWQRKEGNRCRFGIEFISLGRYQEEYLRQQIEQAEEGGSIQDPEDIISSIMADMKKERDRSFNIA